MAVPPKVPRLKVPAVMLGVGRPVFIATKAEIVEKMPKDIAFEEVSDTELMPGKVWTIYAPVGMFSTGNQSKRNLPHTARKCDTERRGG